MFAYVYESPGVRSALAGPGARRLLVGAGLLALCLLVLTAQAPLSALASFVPGVDPPGAPLSWHHPWFYGIVASTLIFVAVATPGSVVNRLFCAFPLRAVGVVSYSLYLVHWLVILKLKQLGVSPGAWLFVATFAISYGISVALYGLVERPFLVRPAERQR